ncbi:NAD(P)-dependent oxidoreductase [Schumannella luteola]|uniref:Phosphoglycerate dehydrogenase-like enzyme n=1 Tax=Schumannella luteola TaxID=472059 RepID=A0A852Y724_9MICO|nr:NAD(P)-dependent oxidoreductase [Schumannella luteola]NYG97672.1 phosphoglycerate dehydrogenase-like enzyme [Schumannella luteola]
MTYRVAITRGMADDHGTTIFGDLGLDRLDAEGIEWQVLADDVAELRADQLDGVDAVIVLGGEKLTAASLPGDGRLKHAARFGAGFDAIDIDAATANGVAVTNTSEAVRRPVADAAVALLFAAAHNLVVKDHLVRDGRWGERHHWHGRGLTGRRVGVIGFGGIGSETARLVSALGVETVAWNRSDRSAEAAELGIPLVGFDELLATSDYVIVTVAGNAGTAHLIGERELALMPAHAQLINVARGSVVDETALVRALEQGGIAGAALDVFEAEPLPTSSPLIGRDDVILAPHALCWTDAFAQAVSRSVIDSVLAIARGEAPATIVNPEAVPVRS